MNMEKRPFIKEWVINGRLFKICTRVRAFVKNYPGDPGGWLTGTVVYFDPCVWKGHPQIGYEILKRKNSQSYFVIRKYRFKGFPCVDYYDYKNPFMMVKIDNPVDEKTWMKIPVNGEHVLFEPEEEYDPNEKSLFAEVDTLEGLPF